MEQNEQTPASDAEGPKLGSLTAVEEVVNQYSRDIAKLCRVRPDQYRIVLITKYKDNDVLFLKRGAVVQIGLPWPRSQANMNSLLREAFHLIATRKMNDVWAVEPYVEVLRRNNERKKWFKEKFGDEAEIFAELLPHSRLRKRASITRTVTVTDRETGISIDVVDAGGKRNQADMEHEARVKLSRVVRAFEASQESEDDNGEGGSIPNDGSSDPEGTSNNGHSEGLRGVAEGSGDDEAVRGNTGEISDAADAYQTALGIVRYDERLAVSSVGSWLNG
jgi:hypothetical protein